jgi:hypothetical protein
VALIPKAASIHGVFVGSRAMFANMLDAVATHGIKPVIDREFAFRGARRPSPSEERRPLRQDRDPGRQTEILGNR